MEIAFREGGIELLTWRGVAYGGFSGLLGKESWWECWFRVNGWDVIIFNWALGAYNLHKGGCVVFPSVDLRRGVGGGKGLGRAVPNFFGAFLIEIRKGSGPV